MKTIKTAIALMALTLGFTTVQAEIYDRLVLKNGKVVAGYIAGQQPGQCIRFYTEEINGGSTRRTTIDDDELIPTSSADNGQFDDINTISVADGLPHTYTFKIGDVTKIERELRPEDQTFGIIDVITTHSGEVYEGQIIGQTLGSSIQLWDGINTQTINNDNLASQEKRPLDASKDIIEQSPFLDVVVTQRVTYRGIIIMQNYGNEQQRSFLRIKEENGQVSRVDISHITELRREVNDHYIASTGKTDFIPEPGVIYFNRQAVKSIPTMKEDGHFILNTDDINGALVLPLENGGLTIIMDDNVDNRNTILLPIEQLKMGRKKMFAFSYEDIVDKAVMHDTSSSKNGILSREYSIQKGCYVLYHRESGNVNFCEFQ
jgi:hypothetical protein